VSKSELDLCYLTATEAVAAFKAKTLSPLDVLRAQIARVEAVNSKLNAITHAYFDRALKEAQVAEDLYVRGAATRPLEGVTCAIKDGNPIKGEITTFGSKAFANFIPDESAPTVERLMNAGAIVHCRTTTPELGHSAITKSPLWGVTRNAWNAEYSSGGSSGGAGSALAAGMTTLADGTDGGGSIRVPAALGGLFGYKPPYGRNPVDSLSPGETLVHYGPLARSVADCALMQNVMSGQHPKDLYSLRDSVVLPRSGESIRGTRIALSMNLGFYGVSKEVRENTLAAAEIFRSLGCIVEEIQLPWQQAVEDAWLIRWQALLWAQCGDLLPDFRNDLDPFVVDLMEQGSRLDLRNFYRTHQTKHEMHQALVAAMSGYDLLIAPTTATTQVPADRHDTDPLLIDGKPISFPYVGWVLTPAFNLLSQYPVISVPSGIDQTTTIPTGLQIIGPAYDDLAVFSAAYAFEAATQPWRDRRPPL
jgi:amidase